MTSQGKDTNGQPMTNTTNALAISGATDADYARFGIARDTIALWEDGARTDGSSGTYEWWYFDAHLDDGTKLVVVFMDKELTAPQKPLDPVIRINLDLPDGRSFEKIQTFAPETYSAATDSADIRIAHNRFVGDLHRYCITAAIDDISVDVTLTGQVPAWRPETGCMLFGADQSLEFCWLPSVPQGVVEATFSIGDETHEASGVGYHDHNWGNVGLLDIIHDWYWARGQAGPYSTITSYITSHKKYGYAEIPIFMLARDGQIIAGDASKVTFERENVYTDTTTGKPVAGVTRYPYEDGVDRYIVTFTRRQDLTRDRMIESIHGLKRLAATLAGFDGAYLRFTGECRVQVFRAGTLVEEHADEAIWELMYFGHAR
jgi:hypothetical protein